MRRTAAIVLISLTGLVLPAVANAAHPTNPLRLAYKHATSYLHKTPCGGHVAIRTGPETAFVKASVEVGYAPGLQHGEPYSWAEYESTGGGRNNPVGDPALFTHCTITFNSAYWWSWSEIDKYWETACVAMIHEAGNLFGWSEVDEGEHESTNLRDLRIDWISPPSVCTHYSLIKPNGKRYSQNGSLDNVRVTIT